MINTFSELRDSVKAWEQEEKTIWYAVMSDHEDTDASFGSDYFGEAANMLRDEIERGNTDAYIAVYDSTDGFCLDEIDTELILINLKNTRFFRF